MESRGHVVGGAILVIAGLLLLLAQFGWGIQDWMLPMGLGILFLVAFLATRSYGFLIPTCILLGLGIPIVLLQTTPELLTGWRDAGIIVPLGLGIGFLAIWVIDVLMGNRRRPGGWWPLIPGGIITLTGLSQLVGQVAWLQDIGRWWPVLLILLGLWVLLSRSRRPA